MANFKYPPPKRELWKELPNFPGYFLSNLGRLRLKPTHDVLKKDAERGNRKDGRPRQANVKTVKARRCLCLRKSGKTFWLVTAREVLSLFVRPPNQGEVARHLDDCPANTWVTNLSWGTHKDNHADGVRNGKHAKKGSSRAKRYGEHALGKPRSQEVRKKISRTKQRFPERQYYGNARDSLGKWA